jgi:hypothetical protein
MSERRRGYDPKKTIVVEGCELFPIAGARLALLPIGTGRDNV